ncbi:MULTISPECIES: DUF2934 domain-containing protein [unclassified Pseudomonas]|uniref:DUF2934 domain-containing protein n=1 Tax=unclassified Pseudomonas TaxID=196821 RepID=UPI000BD371C9|nr:MULTISPECIES: DUF2934 domain-containing protein [unclassified Pseudomonas]PAM82037.1 hypothetical protein CES87_22175 [Pseudomonas sp. ERMR1:02]
MDEQKIREAAYRLWEKQGKPQGQDLEHWYTAEQTVGEDDSDDSSFPMKTSNKRPHSSGENSGSGGKAKTRNGR